MTCCGCACKNAIISEINGNVNVYGNGYQPLESANILHVKGYVIGVGYEAIHQPTVNNITSVS